MGSPALQGFDTFLRHRTAEGPEIESRSFEESKRQAETASQSIMTPLAVSPIGNTPDGEQHGGVMPLGYLTAIAEIRPGPKIRRAVKVQDGHSTGEQLVYQALWNSASVESPDTRLIRIGYGGLQSLCGLDKTNCKDNIQSLIRKLAIEVVSPFSVQRNQGNVYRIFSANAILKRRKAAGMDWVIRNKGVRFVEQPVGD